MEEIRKRVKTHEEQIQVLKEDVIVVKKDVCILKEDMALHTNAMKQNTQATEKLTEKFENLIDKFTDFFFDGRQEIQKEKIQLKLTDRKGFWAVVGALITGIATIATVIITNLY